MTAEMEEKIRRIDRILQGIQNSIDYGVVKQLNKIVEEGITIKSPEQLKTITDVICNGRVGATDKENIGKDGSRTIESETRNCVGDLLIPKNISSLPVLEARTSRFRAPETIPLQDYCLWPGNQEDRPWCAAFAATGFAENILWRKNDYPEKLDPEPIYKYAKENDGVPESGGTTLNAALEALIEKGFFDKSLCKVKVLRNIQHLKYAMHKFGCCLAGFNVTTEWNECYNGKVIIKGDGNYKSLGGHAVLICGYTREYLIIQNSWSEKWGEYGFAYITWEEAEREFLYGAVIDNCLYDTRMN